MAPGKGTTGPAPVRFRVKRTLQLRTLEDLRDAYEIYGGAP